MSQFAQSSPSSKSRNVTNSTYTPSVTPRKAPHCKQCKRPRAGHPRSGCDSPKADQPSNTIASDVGIGLPDALESMQIASAPVELEREREEETKAIIQNRPRRLSAQSQLPASAIPATPKAEPALKNKGKGKYPTRSPMPSTLDTPETSFASSTNSVLKQGTPQVGSPVEEFQATPDESAGPSTTTPTQGQDTPLRRAQPPVRSMSLEQRVMFISQLTVKSSATIYVLPKADMSTVTASATDLGFHLREMKSDDAEDPEALLILGQDLAAVKKLFGKVKEENRRHAE